jgi:hypothetical protein
LCERAPRHNRENEELRDLAAVRLVRREGEDDLHRADEVAVGEGGEQQPTPLVDLGGKAFERAARLLERERRPASVGGRTL